VTERAKINEPIFPRRRSTAWRGPLRGLVEGHGGSTNGLINRYKTRVRDHHPGKSKR
jgi:hypothetical protein